MSPTTSRRFAHRIVSLAALAALAVTVTLAASGCGGDDDDGASQSTGGEGTTATGGSSAGGTDGSGGGSTGGSATGGETAAQFWSAAYNPSGAPDPAAGHHNAGQACMSCHYDASLCDNNVMLFAGTVYQVGGVTGAASVEVGVKDGTGFYSTYSAADGNFWFRDDGSTIDWSNPDVRMRTADAEVNDGDNLVTDDCNFCHTHGGDASPLIAR
jgi:hypothetical protein